MDWSDVDYCDVFISCLGSHSDGTHSLQNIHWWAKGKDVTCGQVWWPMLGICALHLTHPSVHTQQWVVNKHTHTHTPWTHTRIIGQPLMLRRPGGSCGSGALLKETSVVVLKVERALYIHSPPTPPTIPAGAETRTCNLWVTSPTLYTLGHVFPTWCDVMQYYISPNLMKKQTHLHLGWSESEHIFSQFSFLDEPVL